MKEEITKVREVLANTENSSAEEIKERCNELQQKSLKLFEMAYKKVRIFLKSSQCGALFKVFHLFHLTFLRFSKMASEKEDSSHKEDSSQTSEQPEHEKKQGEN